ncbi:MAG: BrnT family toxin [Elusimicrobiota bacterium]
MEFEYNTSKSESNEQKHGISFEEAKILWLVDNIVLPAITRGEKRYMIIGAINGLHFSCIFTIRSSKTRIISCRRSSEKERRLYDEKIEK